MESVPPGKESWQQMNQQEQLEKDSAISIWKITMPIDRPIENCFSLPQAWRIILVVSSCMMKPLGILLLMGRNNYVMYLERRIS